MSTAIAAIPVAATNVVIVVAMTITLPRMDCTILFTFRIMNVVLVLAGAGFTVAEIIFEPTAITTIPVASAVVVTIVAHFVAHPCQHFAWL